MAKAVRGVFESPVGSGVWWVNYYVNGVRRREKVGRRSDAVALYQKRKTDARMGMKMPELKKKRTVLFSEIAADALAYSKEHKASYPGDVSTVNKLLPTLGSTPVQDITHHTLKAYLDTRIEDLTKTTINRYRGTLSMIFQEAIRNGKAESNPARLVRLHKENNAKLRFISYEEEAVIRRIIQKRCPVHEAELTIALETGMRRGEQFSLQWTQVDLSRRQVTLLKTKNGDRRIVTLTRDAADAFRSLPQESDAVFATRYGVPMISPRAWFTLVMRDAVKECPALKDVTWHTFRHTYISRLVMAGVDIRTVQELAGHKTLAMTVRYSHLSPDHRFDAVDRLSLYRSQQRAA